MEPKVMMNLDGTDKCTFHPTCDAGFIPDKDMGPGSIEEYESPDPWKHRSKGMKCKTCMWYVQKAHTLLTKTPILGRCRKHAPTMNGYPAVFPADFCGDHKLDENKL